MKTNLLSFKSFLLCATLCIAGVSFAQQSARAPLVFRSGFNSILRGTDASFTVHKTSGASYYWNFPSSWKVVKGQGTPEITFQTTESSTSGIVTVEEVTGNSRRTSSMPVMLYSNRNSQADQSLFVFDMKVTPSITTSYFNVHVVSDNVTEPVQLRVTDLVGRTIEAKNVSAISSLQVGNNFQAGVYFIEVLQGDTKRQLKVVKQ